MMPGVAFEEITRQVIDAYTQAELADVLKIGMNLRLDRVVALPATLDHIVFELLGWAERMGREVELIRTAARARPDHEGVQSIYTRYGLAVPVFLQQGGAPVVGTPLPVVGAGFEVEVKKYLPAFAVRPWREQLFRLEGRVCHIAVGNGKRGTGFLVGPDTLLTNYHVLEAVLKGTSPATGVRCQFEYKKLADGKTEGIEVKLHATDWRIDESPYSQAEKNRTPDAQVPGPDELDHALVRLERPVGNEPHNATAWQGKDNAPARGWVTVPEGQPDITPQMPVLILQHPNPDSLDLALDTEGVISRLDNNTRVRYATNTASGASGSPCFDLQWNLIALHHYGDPAYQHPRYNQGVPIGAIRDRLKRVGKDGVLGT